MFLRRLIKLILILACLVMTDAILYSQRNWEGVTLEFESTEHDSLDFEIENFYHKFWMEFKHGVVKISNSNNENIESDVRFTHYYYGSYSVLDDTLNIFINRRLLNSRYFKSSCNCRPK